MLTFLEIAHSILLSSRMWKKILRIWNSRVILTTLLEIAARQTCYLVLLVFAKVILIKCREKIAIMSRIPIFGRYFKVKPLAESLKVLCLFTIKGAAILYFSKICQKYILFGQYFPIVLYLFNVHTIRNVQQSTGKLRSHKRLR